MLKSKRVLIVEDEKNLGLTLSEYFQSIPTQCLLARNSEEAKTYFEELKPEVVLMDIGLPDASGMDLASQWRRKRKDFVLFFLSAFNAPELKVQGLEIGAQDYITKPFALKELTLRLERVLHFEELKDHWPEEYLFGRLKFWPKRYEVEDAHKRITSLSQKECAILEILLRKQGEAVPREQIIEEIWGQEKFPTNRTVDNYIVRLRKWSETDANAVEIQSIRGVGYKLLVKG